MTARGDDLDMDTSLCTHTGPVSRIQKVNVRLKPMKNLFFFFHFTFKELKNFGEEYKEHKVKLKMSCLYPF